MKFFNEPTPEQKKQAADALFKVADQIENVLEYAVEIIATVDSQADSFLTTIRERASGLAEQVKAEQANPVEKSREEKIEYIRNVLNETHITDSVWHTSQTSDFTQSMIDYVYNNMGGK